LQHRLDKFGFIETPGSVLLSLLTTQMKSVGEAFGISPKSPSSFVILNFCGQFAARPPSRKTAWEIAISLRAEFIAGLIPKPANDPSAA